MDRSENMPWYDGQSLMHHLENVHVAFNRDLVDTRFPVQYVVRPKSDEFHDYCGYAGRVAGGVLKPGDDVLVRPSGMTSTIEGIDMFDKEIDEAFPPMSVTVRLEDDVDVSRGDMICRPQNAPRPSEDIDAMICWMTTSRSVHARSSPSSTPLDGPRAGQGHPGPPGRDTLHRDKETKKLELCELVDIANFTPTPAPLWDAKVLRRTVGPEPLALGSACPRIVLVLDGEVVVAAGDDSFRLGPGQAGLRAR